MKKYRILLLFLICIDFSLQAQEQFIPPRPERFTPVVDSAKVLSAEQITTLTNKIKRFEDSTGSQIAVVFIPSLKGYDVESYAYEWYKKWEYGQKKNNNGVLVFAGINDRKMHIEVGYGLEGAIPDALAKRIIEDHLKPNFRNSDYYQGADEAVDKLAQLASGEPYEKEVKSPPMSGWDIVIVLICFLFLPLLLVGLIIYWIVKAVRNKNRSTTISSKGTKSNYIPPTSGSSYSDYSDSSKRSYSDYSDKYSDYSDSYSDYSDSGGGSSGGGGASGDW